MRRILKREGGTFDTLNKPPTPPGVHFLGVPEPEGANTSPQGESWKVYGKGGKWT